MFIDEIPTLMIVKIYKKSIKKQQYLLTKYNLTEQQMLYLTIIYKSKDGIRLTDLVELLEIDKSNITRTIKQLEDKDYVIRDVAKLGERKFKVYLSQKGQEIALALLKKQNEIKQKLSKDFTSEEMAVIMRVIDKILSADI